MKLVRWIVQHAAGRVLSPEELSTEAARVTVRRAENAIKLAEENNQRMAAMLASRQVVEHRHQQQQDGRPR